MYAHCTPIFLLLPHWSAMPHPIPIPHADQIHSHFHLTFLTLVLSPVNNSVTTDIQAVLCRCRPGRAGTCAGPTRTKRTRTDVHTAAVTHRRACVPIDGKQRVKSSIHSRHEEFLRYRKRSNGSHTAGEGFTLGAGWQLRIRYNALFRPSK